MRITLQCPMTGTQGKSSYSDAPDEPPSADPDYLVWKENKIRKALKEAEDRSSMISAEKVWEKFGLER